MIKIICVIIIIFCFLMSIYTYKIIRDICGHINDSLVQFDLELARVNLKLDETEKKVVDKQK